MALQNLIKLRRSATPAKVPTTGQLSLGELAINTNDGKMYFKKDDGAESIIEVLSDLTGLQLSGGTLTGFLTLHADPTNAFHAATKQYVDNNAGPGTITIDNLDDGVDYTAGSSTAITLSTATKNGVENDITYISFSGGIQHHDTFTLSGTTVTFDAAIPSGVSSIQVVYFS